MEELKAKLKSEYDMKDLKELHYYLRVDFKRNRATRTITMSQTKYIEEVLERLNMRDIKPIGTPLDANVKLMKLLDEEYKQYEAKMQDVQTSKWWGC